MGDKLAWVLLLAGAYMILKATQRRDYQSTCPPGQVEYPIGSGLCMPISGYKPPCPANYAQVGPYCVYGLPYEVGSGRPV